MAATDPLFRLVAVLQSSPAMYLADSGIGSYPGAEDLKRAIAALVVDQRGVMGRAVAVLDQREVPPPRRGYPIAYTAWHDLGLEALLPRVIESLQRQIGECESIVTAGAGDATVTGLAGEAIASGRRHLDLLKQLAARLRAGLSGLPTAASA